MSINDIKSTAIKLMNEYGEKKVPFIFIIDYEMKEPVVLQLKESAASDIFFSTNEKNGGLSSTVLKNNVSFVKYPVPFEEYKKAFNEVLHEINAGNTYLLNLTFPTKIETRFTLKEIYLHVHAKYKLLFKNKFVVFSPESFVKIRDGLISSYPMKGTIDDSIVNAEQIILNDKKEIAEHNTIVDLIRNDLSIVAKKVHVEKYRYVEKVITNEKTLLQVSSKIVGQLEHGYEKIIGYIIFSLLPAGSISGAPKKKTLEIIKAVESYSRGYYTGIFGYFDGSVLDSAVMIRFIENTGDGLIYKSGGGITFMSDLESEYQELIDKVYVPVA